MYLSSFLYFSSSLNSCTHLSRIVVKLDSFPPFGKLSSAHLIYLQIEFGDLLLSYSISDTIYFYNICKINQKPSFTNQELIWDTACLETCLAIIMDMMAILVMWPGTNEEIFLASTRISYIWFHLGQSFKELGMFLKYTDRCLFPLLLT